MNHLPHVASLGYRRLALGLCLTAGVFYNSWPLGYSLDKTVAQKGLASNLEIAGRPYYWVFVLGDILTTVCLIMVIVLLRLKFWQSSSLRAKLLITAGLLVFGLFTTISALLPAHCVVTSFLRCSADHGSKLTLDSFTSGIACFGLFMSMAGLVFGNLDSRQPRRWLSFLTLSTLIGWSISSAIFIVIAVGNGSAQVAEYVLLLLSGMAIFIIGLNLEFGLRLSPSSNPHTTPVLPKASDERSWESAASRSKF